MADGATRDLAPTVREARYAKGMVLVKTTPDGTGMKTRAQRLACALKGRYTNRERGFIMRPSTAVKLQRLYQEGWDASFITHELTPPKIAYVHWRGFGPAHAFVNGSTISRCNTIDCAENMLGLAAPTDKRCKRCLQAGAT